MRRYLLVVAALGLLVPGCALVSAEPTGAGSWERLPDPPLRGRTEPVVEAVGDRVYVMGGWTALCPPNADCALPETPPFADGAVLDLVREEWRPIADAPYGLRNAPSAVVGGDVFVASSCHHDAHCDAPYDLLRYDPETDRWDERAGLPPGMRYVTLVPLGDRLLALEEDGPGRLALYRPGDDRWELLPEDPLPRSHGRFVVPDGERLLLFGSTGVEDGERRKVAAALDLRTLSWSRLPDAPGPGYQAWRVGADVWLNPHYGPGGGIFDPSTETWREFPTPPEPTEFDLAGLVGGARSVYEYSEGWVRDVEAGRWLRVPERPDPSYDETVAAVGDALVVMGGQKWVGDEGELVAETWIWRP